MYVTLVDATGVSVTSAVVEVVLMTESGILETVYERNPLLNKGGGRYNGDFLTDTCDQYSPFLPGHSPRGAEPPELVRAEISVTTEDLLYSATILVQENMIEPFVEGLYYSLDLGEVIITP